MYTPFTFIFIDDWFNLIELHSYMIERPLSPRVDLSRSDIRSNIRENDGLSAAEHPPLQQRRRATKMIVFTSTCSKGSAPFKTGFGAWRRRSNRAEIPSIYRRNRIQQWEMWSMCQWLNWKRRHYSESCQDHHHVPNIGEVADVNWLALLSMKDILTGCAVQDKLLKIGVRCVKCIDVLGQPWFQFRYSKVFLL